MGLWVCEGCLQVYAQSDAAEGGPPPEGGAEGGEAPKGPKDGKPDDVIDADFTDSK